MAPHKHWKTGVLCNCGFGPRETAEAMLLSKTASKLDWLRQRPDFQKPEKARLLQSLEDAVARHGEKVDPLLPWIAREVKKGRLNHLTPQPQVGNDLNGLARDIRRPPTVQDEEGPYSQYGEAVNFGHLGDWWQSGHPTAQGVDLMQHTYPQVADKVKEWEAYLQSQQEQADQAKAAGGEILHQYPDGWSVRRLDPEQLEFEGDAMGHCVGGYGYEDQVRRGDTQILSLRDPQHQPHATMELETTNYGPDKFDLEDTLANAREVRGLPEELKNHLRRIHEYDQNKEVAETMPDELAYWPVDDPHDSRSAESLYHQLLRTYGETTPLLDNALIRQIQGKSDTVPKPEYQQRLKEWFQTFPEETRPDWEESEPMTHIDQLVDPDNYRPDYEGGYAEGGYGPHGDYGLAGQRPISYDEVLPSMLRDHGRSYGDGRKYSPYDGQALYQEALKRGEIPEFGNAVTKFGEEQQDNFDEWRDMNYEHTAPYPDDEAEEFQDENGNFNSEAYNEAMKAYDEDVDQWASEHAGMEATNHLYGFINRHNYEGGMYTNEIKPPEQQGFVPNQAGTPLRDLPESYVIGPDGAQRYVGSDSNRMNLFSLPGYDSMHVPEWIKPIEKPQTFSKVARQAHPHITTGEPCTCPWGGKQRLATVKQGSKMQWLRERPDKRLQTEWGQALLDELENNYHSDKTDPLMPWLAREWKKGRVIHDPTEYPYLRYKHSPPPDDEGRTYREVTPPMEPGILEHWGDWFRSNSPTRRGVDLMQHSISDIQNKVYDWDAELQAKMDEERQMKGQVVHQFPDNWSIRRLENGQDARDEGDAMGHCVGGYRREIENGNVGIYSLRDPKNNPHATIEMRPKYWSDPERGDLFESHDRPQRNEIPQTEGATMWQVQGKGNGPPNGEYQDRIRQWVESHEETPVMPEGEPHRTWVPAPTDPEMLEYYYEPEHDDYGGGYDPYRLNPGEGEVYGLEDTGDGYDEDPFDYEGPPDWDKIVYSLLHDTWRQGQGTEPRYGLNNADRVREIASEMGFQDDPLNDAVRQAHPALLQEFYRDEYDPSPLYPFGPQDQWNAWHKGEMMNRLVGQNMLTQDPEGLPIGNPPLTELHPDQEKMFGENFGNGERTWLPYTHQPQPPTRQNPGGVFSRVSSVPLYYRWTFSPVTGEVDLNHNGDEEVRYHGDMASDRNEPDLVHGYAYRIGGGYRLTDWDHKAIEDPFVIAQVMRKLRGEKGPANEQDWEASGDDFDRMHQGMPTQAL